MRPPSWPALQGRRVEHAPDAPLHLKPAVVAALKVEALMEEADEDLQKALRWICPSEYYDIIESAIRLHPNPRHFTHPATMGFTRDDIALLQDAAKLEHSTDPRAALCNCFTSVEHKEDGLRRRTIIEPKINDAIKESEYLTSNCTVQYTPRDRIRFMVWAHPQAIQYDFAAWFDQIPLHSEVRKYFGVGDEGTLRLTVLPMGFRASCKVAQAITTTLMQSQHNAASCVDNVAFFGTKDELLPRARAFLERCAAVGAVVKDSMACPTQRHTFLGEFYDHAVKTRALAEKSMLKAEYVFRILRASQGQARLRTRQIMAIYGLLLYAAGTLDIDVATFHWAMRYLSSIATKPLHEMQNIPPQVVEQLILWAAVAAANRPVYVWRNIPERVDLRIYTDASARGWGALAIQGVSVRWVRREWQVHTESSVASEPRALALAACFFIQPREHHRVAIFTDHLPLIYAWQKGWGKAYEYSKVCALLHVYRDQGVHVDLIYIPGPLNPADALSRSFDPPTLNVTHVGGQRLAPTQPNQ